MKNKRKRIKRNSNSTKSEYSSVSKSTPIPPVEKLSPSLKKDPSISVESDKDETFIEATRPETVEEETLVVIKKIEDYLTKDDKEVKDNFLNHNSADDLSLNIEKDEFF